MSVAAESPAGPTEPTSDLHYSIHDHEVGDHADSRFVNRRIEEAVLMECAGSERVLDVACGAGQQAAQIWRNGSEAWGLDPSEEMLGVSRWLIPAEQVILVRGLAEWLPIRDGTFDRVVCRCSLDHFVDPERFMLEAKRLLSPGGRVVILLYNYRSLACRLGPVRQRLARSLGRPAPLAQPYWEPPPDHYSFGDLSFVQGLGNGALQLERCYGLSLLWAVYRWGTLLDTLPGPLANGVLTSLDKIAYRTPSLADIIVSVWQQAPGETSSL